MFFDLVFLFLFIDARVWFALLTKAGSVQEPPRVLEAVQGGAGLEPLRRGKQVRAAPSPA